MLAIIIIIIILLFLFFCKGKLTCRLKLYRKHFSVWLAFSIRNVIHYMYGPIRIDDLTKEMAVIS